MTRKYNEQLRFHVCKRSGGGWAYVRARQSTKCIIYLIALQEDISVKKQQQQ